MNGNWEDHLIREQKTQFRAGIPKGKINSLLTELIDKEEEIKIYKNRLKELETAFYYNLELITERDLELSLLEKQLGSENEQLQDLIREKNELKDLIKVINNKNNKKLKQLERKLSLKEEEIRDIEREKKDKVNSLKKLMEDVKHQEEKKISRMISQFEIQKREIIKNFEEELEEKEKYYLLEVDNLSEKLTQVCLEKEELIKEGEESKSHLEDLKKLFLEKENQYLEEIRKKDISLRKVSKEVQCDIKPQVLEKEIQSRPDNTTIHSQTNQTALCLEDDYIEKIKFLQEQNEVLKFIVKDLKKNRDVPSTSGNPGQPPGCECLKIKTEIEQINNKFESEINNLKEILEEEQKRRKEEDAVIQGLETSVTCLKDKLLSGLQEKLDNFEGEDLCTYTYNREIQTEIQITLLEEKLSMKMDSLIESSEEENKKVHKKLDELKQEWTEKLEKYIKPREEIEVESAENFLEKIRKEIQKLETKIETDMNNLIKNNNDRNKCDKNVQRKVQGVKRVTFAPCDIFPEVECNDFANKFYDVMGSGDFFYRNDYPQENCVSILKYTRDSNFQNQFGKRPGEQKEFQKVTNNLVMGRRSDNFPSFVILILSERPQDDARTKKP